MVCFFFKDISPFCRATDTPVLDFWWHLLWVSKPEGIYLVVSFYRPQRSCGQGYVFTCVCDSVHRGGLRVGRSPWAGRTPPGSRPPQAGRNPPPRQGEPPTPGRENPPRADTPPGADPPWAGRTPPEQKPPPLPPRADTTPPGSRLQHTVNERPVRILLECILV